MFGSWEESSVLSQNGQDPRLSVICWTWPADHGQMTTARVDPGAFETLNTFKPIHHMNKSAWALLALGLFSGFACKSSDDVSDDANYEVSSTAKPITLDITGMT
ncbi:MAG: hypothetical protein ACI8X5_001957 [Planctomycetota bacterium]|jgi:hypothetical protein